MFTPATAQQADNTVSLRFWHPYTDERQAALEALVSEFNTAHQKQIEVQATSFSNSGLLYDQMILQLQNPVSLPNLIMVWPHEAALFDLADTIVDLTPYTDTIDLQGYNPITQEYLGMPDRTFYPVLMVNLEALHALGADTPPTNFDELQILACQFRAAGGWSEGKFGVAWGYMYPLDAEVWLGLLSGQSEALYSNGVFHLNTATAQTRLQALLNAQAGGCMTPVALSTDALLTFAEGRSLFYLGSSSSLELVRDTIAATFATPFELGVYPLGENQRVPTYGPVLSMVNHATPTNAAAWTFIEWWLQPAQHQHWLAATHTAPLPADWEAMPLPALAGYDVVRLEIRALLQQLLAGTLPIEEGLATLENNANQIIQDFSKEPR